MYAPADKMPIMSRSLPAASVREAPAWSCDEIPPWVEEPDEPEIVVAGRPKASEPGRHLEGPPARGSRRRHRLGLRLLAEYSRQPEVAAGSVLLVHAEIGHHRAHAVPRRG